MKITVSTRVRATPARVWQAWTTPAEIMQWNAASDDWHTTSSTVDLRTGGAFSSRMEAKDGSMGFDFHGQYTVVDAPTQLDAIMGDRALNVRFTQHGDHVDITETFDGEPSQDADMQRAGWQAILDNFKRHVESGC